MFKKISHNLLFLLVIFVFPAVSAETVGAGTSGEVYRIGVDDQISINVWKNTELSLSMPVRPDGKISMPLIGDVVAGGRTPEEVAGDIRERLSTFIRDPNVTIILTDLRSHEYISRIRITGAVTTPSSIPYRQGITVLDAVLASGGINDFASANNTKIYRKDAASTHVIDVKLSDILNKGQLDTNVLLLPGDIVTVPESMF